jgi:hypothetical protein
MALVRLALRLAPTRLLAWLDRRRAPLGERIATLAWREGTRRWKHGRTAHDQFIPF